nr:hypothetical protein BgiMline_020236 [Biomphalaria glabrata]
MPSRYDSVKHVGGGYVSGELRTAQGYHIYQQATTIREEDVKKKICVEGLTNYSVIDYTPLAIISPFTPVRCYRQLPEATTEEIKQFAVRKVAHTCFRA